MRVNRLVSVLLIALVYSLLGLRAYGQSIEELRAQRQAVQRRIDEANRLIKETTDSTKSNLARVALLESKIEASNALLENLGKQENHYSRELAINHRRVDSLEQSLGVLKEEYARFLKASQFRMEEHSMLLYLLSSKDIAQLYRRLRFYKEYLTYQSSRYEQIMQEEAELQVELQSLDENRTRLSAMRQENEDAKQKMEREQERYNSEVARLKRTQSGLEQQVEQDKRRMEELRVAIERLLKREREQSGKIRRDAEYLELSKSFQKNKGKLPWPVNSGAITRGYGLERSKIYRHVQTNSEGVYITTKPNAKVFPVFAGRVTLISEIAGQNMTVIVRHGDYLSLYSNLLNINVKMNDEVTPRSVLGEVAGRQGDGGSVLHFEIWKSGKDKPTSQDPELWLRP